MNHHKSIFGGIVAFAIATSCCWLPAIVIALGGGSVLMALSTSLEKFSGAFMLMGVVLLGYGIYAYRIKNKGNEDVQVILNSTITCPTCQHQKEETMPTDACQYFYECEKCKEILKPRPKDCCVYCSYGTIPCPPIQLNQDCC